MEIVVAAIIGGLVGYVAGYLRGWLVGVAYASTNGKRYRLFGGWR